jgi:hypothetical protein
MQLTETSSRREWACEPLHLARPNLAWPCLACYLAGHLSGRVCAGAALGGRAARLERDLALPHSLQLFRVRLWRPRHCALPVSQRAGSGGRGGCSGCGSNWRGQAAGGGAAAFLFWGSQLAERRQQPSGGSAQPQPQSSACSGCTSSCCWRRWRLRPAPGTPSAVAVPQRAVCGNRRVGICSAGRWQLGQQGRRGSSRAKGGSWQWQAS